MATRCLNKATLIGNLTRDPELRYTPGGMAVVSFGVATNRSWMTKQGEKKEDAQFHRIVAWNKLAELCSQLLAKGMRVFVEGRLQYREWMGQDDQKKQVTEIVISDMIILSPNRNMGSVKVSGASPAVATGGAVGAVDGSIEDIVIPDEDIDLGDSGQVAEKEKKSTKEAKDVKDVKEVKEVKKEEDMPF